jgi:hypothetical protein
MIRSSFERCIAIAVPSIVEYGSEFSGKGVSDMATKGKEPGSVSTAIHVYPTATGAGKELAEERLFRFLMGPLEARTEKTLGGYGPAVDPQEAAQSAARSTITNLRGGRLSGVTDREELKRVALHKARNKTATAARKIYANKRGSRPHHVEIDDPDRRESIATEGVTAEERAVVSEFVASCPRDEQVVYLCRRDGWEIKEIAAMMKVSARTVNGLVKSLYERAAEYAGRK